MKLQRKIYTQRREKVVDLLLGIFLFLALNSLLAGIGIGWATLSTSYYDSIPAFAHQTVGLVLNCFPLILNIALIVLFAFWRPWIALGMVAGIAVLLVITLCLAVVAGAACLVMLSQIGQ